MSAVEESPELKAGHAPAMKVGNVRVARNRTESGEKLTSEELAKQIEECGTEVAEKPTNVVISGLVTKDDKVFTPEAVKAYHEKPMPAHEKSHQPQHHMNIQQPRK